MNMPQCERGYILLCDDIREEVDGRQSLIGLHGPSLRVPVLPFTHRSLSAFVQLVNPKVAYPSVEFELLGPDDSLLASGRASTPEAQATGATPAYSSYRLHFYPVPMALQGAYRVRVWFDRSKDEGLEAVLRVTEAENA